MNKHSIFNFIVNHLYFYNERRPSLMAYTRDYGLGDVGQFVSKYLQNTSVRELSEMSGRIERCYCRFWLWLAGLWMCVQGIRL